MYKEIILELNRNPLNKQKLEDFDVHSRELNPLCGDDISVWIKFDEKNVVDNIGFEGHGCAISQAAMSLLTDAIKGKSREELMKMSASDIYELLGFEVVYTRQKCALLGLQAVQHALKK